MMKALRKHKDWLMIVIAILAIPFIFYFVQRPDYGAMRSDRFARMYDRNVSMLEAQQMARLLSLAQALGRSEPESGCCPIHPQFAGSAPRGRAAWPSSRRF